MRTLAGWWLPPHAKGVTWSSSSQARFSHRVPSAARHVQPGSWSVLGYITMNCATLGEAMARILPYERLVGDMGTSRIDNRGDQVCLSWHCRHPHQPVRRHLIENVLASFDHRPKKRASH